MYNLWRFVALNDSKISFVAINAVLSRIFCRNLRAFVWRKIVPKIVCVEKKRQISGMIQCTAVHSFMDGYKDEVSSPPKHCETFSDVKRFEPPLSFGTN